MTGVGVVVSADRVDDADACRPDYLEPSLGSALVRTGDDVWNIAPEFVRRRHPSFAVLFPGELRLADPRASLDPVWRYLDAVLPLVASIAEPGARIVFGSGTARTVPDGVSRADAVECFARVVRGARDRASAQGMRIVLEPLNRGETNLLHSTGEAAALLDEHGIDDVEVVADLFHVMSEGESFDAIASRVGRIGHVHLADGGRRFVGAGGYPWREFLSALLRAGYRGDVSLECTWGEDYVGELSTSLDLVRAEIGRSGAGVATPPAPR